MKSSEKAIIATLAALALFLTSLVGYIGIQTIGFLTSRPLGPALDLPHPTLIDSEPAPLTIATSPSSPAVAGTDTPAPGARCGGPPVMNLLAIGSDARSDSYNYGLADVIRFARIDFVTPRVGVLELPRDLWVEIPEIYDYINQNHEKLNQAYLYGNPGFGYFDHPSAGPGLLARTLELNFGLRADHYVAVNMVTFTKIVDALDGIDLTLEEAVDGRTSTDRSSRLYFSRGKHHLNGTEALTLARLRPEGVTQRGQSQNIILCALKKRLLQPDVAVRLPDLISAFVDNIQTDMSLEQLGQLACLGPQLEAENLVFASFPDELLTQSRQYDPVFEKRVFVWEADFGALREISFRFAAGLWPAAGDVATADDEGFRCPL